MTDLERRKTIAEAARLGTIILQAQERFQHARPRSRAAYHAQKLRARRRYQEFDLRLREQGFVLGGPLEAPFLIEMDEAEKAAFAAWKGTPAGNQAS